MMAVNRGFEWQVIFRKLCRDSGLDCVIFYDPIQRFKGIDNPADFVISKDKNSPAKLIECKSTGAGRWDIRFRQHKALLELANFDSWVVIWFHRDKQVWAINNLYIKKLIASGVKSVSINKLENNEQCFEVPGEWKAIKPKSLDFYTLWQK